MPTYVFVRVRRTTSGLEWIMLGIMRAYNERRTCLTDYIMIVAESQFVLRYMHMLRPMWVSDLSCAWNATIRRSQCRVDWTLMTPSPTKWTR